MDVLKIERGAIAMGAIAGPDAGHCCEAVFITISGYWP
jgi:hypothetical protein